MVDLILQRNGAACCAITLLFTSPSNQARGARIDIEMALARLEDVLGRDR